MPVDPKRVQTLFLSAVECDEPAARAALLERECATDPELRHQVDALLREYNQPDSALDNPIVGPDGHATPTRPDDNGLERAARRPSIPPSGPTRRSV
jgi:hypothetical protein